MSTTATSEATPHLPPVPRRQLLRGSLAVAAASGVVAVATRTAAVGAESLPAWSDPATWGTAGIPRPGAKVVIDFPVRLDQDIQVSGLHVECGGHVVLDPEKSITIRSTGNVEVCGLLEMRPARANVQHLLRFEGIDESRYVGGGMAVLASDVGLWVHEEGQLDLHGTPRTAWVRAAGSLAAGDRTVRLAAAPTGWRVGDEIAITPTGSPVDRSHALRFDEATITAITGSVVTLSSPLRYGHPQIAVGDGNVLTAEVLNLTRNVRVEGTPEGRTHTMALMVSRPSQVRYAAFRHFGPRKQAGGTTEIVLGRYGLHWHMCSEGSRGSEVEGVVMRDGGSHAFVPHSSNGVTHRACISYDTAESAYWWDRAVDPSAASPESDDVVYLSCVAALVRAIPETRGYSMTGFFLGPGAGSIARDCVAVGVQGTTGASGFHWPGGSTAGVWDFTHCVAHNNRTHGIHTWQNTPEKHIVERFICFHNGGAGINHGAYRNNYTYRDSILYGNAGGGVVVHAVSKTDRPIILENLLVDNAGLSDNAIAFAQHIQSPLGTTKVVACRLRGYRDYGIAFTAEGPESRSSFAELVDVIGCEFSGDQFWLSERVDPGSRIRVIDDSRSLLITPVGRSARAGRVRRGWNGQVSQIARFAEVVSPESISVRVVSSS